MSDDAALIERARAAGVFEPAQLSAPDFDRLLALAEIGAGHPQDARLREAATWVLNCIHGTGKSGGTPEEGEYEAAAKALRAALAAGQRREKGVSREPRA